MMQAETVLKLLGQNGGSLDESIAFNLSHVQSMGAFVQEHLATGQEPVGRGALNAKLIECGQVRTNSGSRAVGFCYVVFAYHILHETSPLLFHSTEGFLLKYPDYATGTHADINSALTMCNMTIAALKILKGEKNKAAFVEIVTRICLGPEASVITGGGKVGGDEKRTLPAERFYVEESGIIPEKRKKGTEKNGTTKKCTKKKGPGAAKHQRAEKDGGADIVSDGSSQGSKRSRTDSDDGSVSTQGSTENKLACLSLAPASPPASSPLQCTRGASTVSDASVSTAYTFSDELEMPASFLDQNSRDLMDSRLIGEFSDESSSEASMEDFEFFGAAPAAVVVKEEEEGSVVTCESDFSVLTHESNFLEDFSD